MARFEIFESLPSTQTVCLDRLRAGKEGPGWVMARTQTKGMGRHGRHWIGQKGNLMASRYEIMAMDVRHVPQLSFVTALAVYEMLRPLVPDTEEYMRIKWPNDIMHRGRKLCGILVQTEPTENEDRLGVVIGVGMNLRIAPIIEGYPTVALQEISLEAKKLDAEALLRKLNGHLDGVLDLWREKPFSDIAKAWLKRAYGRERMLHVVHNDAEIAGTMLGLDDTGALQIQTTGGDVVAISNGDVTYGAPLAVGN